MEHPPRKSKWSFCNNPLTWKPCCDKRFKPMRQLLRHHEIIPDMLMSVPLDTINVTFHSDFPLTISEIVTPTQVKDRPFCTWETTPDAWYTLLMVDLDAPSREEPTFGQWLHWLVVNIQAEDFCCGQTLAEYIGAGPPRRTGLHRYVFLVYRQWCKLDFDEPIILKNSGKNRPKFDCNDFSKKYALGDPIAISFFRAEWDCYVRVLYRQLGAGNPNHPIKKCENKKILKNKEIKKYRKKQISYSLADDTRCGNC